VNNERIFCGCLTTGFIWADRWHERHGDYVRLAYMNYRTLELEIEKGCPAILVPDIKADAEALQAMKGQRYPLTATNEVTLGGECRHGIPIHDPVPCCVCKEANP